MHDDARRGDSSIPTRIYVCSSNRGKLKDFSSAVSAYRDMNLLVEPLPGLDGISPPEESGNSFEENAIAKARHYSSFTSALVLADDSGLEVDALDGAPGIHSARYAGNGATDRENNDLLLRNLANLPGRHARFVCVLAMAQESKVLLTARGTVSGTILTSPRGTGGFGYDPLFFYPPLNRSFGELNPEEKLSVSHRGNALRHLFERLHEILPR